MQTVRTARRCVHIQQLLKQPIVRFVQSVIRIQSNETFVFITGEDSAQRKSQGKFTDYKKSNRKIGNSLNKKSIFQFFALMFIWGEFHSPGNPIPVGNLQEM